MTKNLAYPIDTSGQEVDKSWFAQPKKQTAEYSYGQWRVEDPVTDEIAMKYEQDCSKYATKADLLVKTDLDHFIDNYLAVDSIITATYDNKWVATSTSTFQSDSQYLLSMIEQLAKRVEQLEYMSSPKKTTSADPIPKVLSKAECDLQMSQESTNQLLAISQKDDCSKPWNPLPAGVIKGVHNPNNDNATIEALADDWKTTKNKLVQELHEEAAKQCAASDYDRAMKIVK